MNSPDLVNIYMKVGLFLNYTVLLFEFSQSRLLLSRLALGCPTPVAAGIGETPPSPTEKGAVEGELN